jgi:hypothetical protein
MLYDGDGSDEPGFVAPEMGKAPPPPPAHISSAETYVPYPGPPAVPMARSEKKNPPKPPVLFTKLRSNLGPLDWGTRPNDLNNLIKSMKALIDVDFSSEVKSLREVDTDPEKNPILYRSGHFHFRFSDGERARLREYLIRGGMIIFNAGMGSKPFYDSAIAEMKAIFPEIDARRLSPDHPVFHAYYDLERVGYRSGVREAGYAGNEPWFDAVTLDCRVVALISRWGLDIGWDATNDDSMRGYTVDSAQKLGVNIMAYATALRAWAKQLAQALKFIDKPEGSDAGKVAITQVVYDGEWKTRHKGLSILLQQFNQKTDVPVKFAVAERRLTDPAIVDSPLLYMTGHEDFTLSAPEVAALRRYLERGGLLMAEACCGRRAFDQAFRRELRRALPGHELEAIPPGDTILALPNPLDRVAVTPALAAQQPSASAMAPRLEAVIVDGYRAVIYSTYGMAGGWEMAQNPYSLGYDDASSLRLGENILMNALVH